MVRSLLIALLILIFGTISVHAGDLNISAAASLREAIIELTTQFSKDSAAIKFQNNFAGSGSLAKQIENGAPADIFFSANREWMEYLKDRKLLDQTSITVLAYNELVFVGNPRQNIVALQDILKLQQIAIGSPKSVPAGDYAMQALKKAGMDRQLENKLVMAKDVRECLLYADRGEVDGAFVYKTDAQMAKNVKILFTVPQDLYPRVTYPVALTITGSKKAEAARFFKFLQSSTARNILIKHGFSTKE
jgi:molybdate transport system substrate-binding protein